MLFSLRHVTRLATALILAASAALAEEARSPVVVYYVGEADAVESALRLTDRIRLTDRPEEASVFVLNRIAGDETRRIRAAAAAGKGLVVFLGKDLAAGTLADLGLEGVVPTRETSLAALSPTPAAGPMAEAINWRAAPQIGPRYALEGSGLETLIATDADDSEAVVAEARVGTGRCFLITPDLSEPANRPFLEWPYFNYLVYRLTAAAAGVEPLDYAAYPGSPVPHGPLKTTILLGVALLLAGTVAAFVLVRRYSLRHPEALERMVADVGRFHVREGESPWEQVGFHRGIAGLMVAILNNIWLFVPITVLINVVLFGIVLPSAQIRGAVSLVGMFFGTVWILMDWGTGVAAQKFLSQHRVHNPTQGIKFVQFFVWWQALTGTIQVGALALFALYYLPQTSLAYLSLFVLLHVLIQYPGFQSVFEGVLFPGLQRYDYQSLIGTAVAFLGPAFQIGCCVLMISWGKDHPTYAPIAGALGLGLGELLRLSSVLVIGFLLYRRLGLSARVVFLAHFDLPVVKTSLVFGLPITLIGLFYFGAYTLQVWLLSRWVLNYTEVQANIDVALSMVASVPNIGPYVAIFAFAASFMNSFSESYSHGKMKLARYYATASIKWGQFLAMFLMAVTLAVGDRFILGSLPAEQYARGIVWMRVFAILWLFSPLIWVGDAILVGIGKPHLQMWSMLAEQGTRMVCLLLLARPMQATGIILAYCLSIPIKAVVDVIFVRKHLEGLYINVWQTVAAPLLSALILCGVLRVVGDIFWSPNGMSSSLLLAAGLIGALPFHFLLSGLFGGWDDGGLNEFRRAVPLSSVARPFAWLFLKFTEAGCRWSPLHGRFATRGCDEAMAEAEALTHEKVRLERFAETAEGAGVDAAEPVESA